MEVHPLENQLELANERRIARKEDDVVTVSESIAHHMAGLLGVPQPTVVRNLPYASSVAGPSDLRRLLRMAPEAKLLVYTGKATFNRGLEEVIDAMASLPPSVHLLVLGNFEPRFKAVLDAKVTEHGLEGRFHHHGPVPSEEVSRWASSGDLCLVPIKGVCLSYEYCLPNKLFEGIQAGLPILATNLVEMRRTLEQYGCGLTYQSGNIGDLRAKILHILGTPGVSEQLRSNAVKAARQLNWENEKRRLLQLLKERTSPART
jgi:glycosyltransferase involved in cell wall biosynthesis